MNPGKYILPALLAVLAAMPVLLARGNTQAAEGAATVIIYTPHNEQIRAEFGRAFEAWHQRTHGRPATVVWNTPGGTSEIRRILDANAEAALREGRPIGGNADLVFGGGSYEYGQLKREITVERDGEKRTGRVLEPAPIDPAWLAQSYGDNRIGDETLYDPERYWFGT
ncbi:MAG: hypothetical protein ACKOYN_12450, partial [Planctomycetota bacterium]